MQEFVVYTLFGFLSLKTMLGIYRLISCRDEAVESHTQRLRFFIMASLMLVCMVSMALLGFFWSEIWFGAGIVAFLNIVGFFISYYVLYLNSNSGQFDRTVRAYNIYYRGRPIGIVTKVDFEKLFGSKLLKRQQSVELVDDYTIRARRKGLKVVSLKNPETGQTLIKVE